MYQFRINVQIGFDMRVDKSIIRDMLILLIINQI